MTDSVTLATLGGGVAQELFGVELTRVLSNIQDINTDAGARRSITLTVTFSPDNERGAVETHVTVTSKLAPITKFRTQLYVGRRHGRVVAVESDPRQGSFFDGEAPKATGTVAQFPEGGDR